MKEIHAELRIVTRMALNKKAAVHYVQFFKFILNFSLLLHLKFSISHSFGK